ncbi:MAG: hypothetical protein AAFZ89_16655 [Bacteroidota bacterium]
MNEAIWALIGVVLGGVITGGFNFYLQKKQFEHNIEMFQLQNRSRENVKEILEELLWHKKFIERSFSALKKNVGGFDDDEIRILLHEIDAIKTVRKSDSTEWWYLNDRKEERLQRLKSK